MTKVLFFCSFHISALWFFTQFSKRRIYLFLVFETGNLIKTDAIVECTYCKIELYKKSGLCSQHFSGKLTTGNLIKTNAMVECTYVLRNWTLQKIRFVLTRCFRKADPKWLFGVWNWESYKNECNGWMYVLRNWTLQKIRFVLTRCFRKVDPKWLNDCFYF